jgi:hypothetical protein
MKNVKIGNLEIPENYFELTPEQKEAVCCIIYDDIYTIVNRNFPYKNVDKKLFLQKVIESSLITNVSEEKYEIAAVLKDIKEMLNQVNE